MGIFFHASRISLMQSSHYMWVMCYVLGNKVIKVLVLPSRVVLVDSLGRILHEKNLTVLSQNIIML